MTRAVLFDIGDTLVERPTIGPGKRIAQALGLPKDTARTITRLVFTNRFASPVELAARLQTELDLTADPTAAVTEIWDAQATEPVEVAGATACVRAARDAGARIGILSNIWAPYAAGFRRACPDIAGLIDSWHLSFEAGVVKPDHAFFRAALAALDVAPAHAVMVGDSLDKDIIPALVLGLRAVWVHRGADPASAAASSGVPAGTVVVTDLPAARDAILAVM